MMRPLVSVFHKKIQSQAVTLHSFSPALGEAEAGGLLYKVVTSIYKKGSRTARAVIQRNPTPHPPKMYKLTKYFFLMELS